MDDSTCMVGVAKFFLERWLKNRRLRKDGSTEIAEADAEAVAMIAATTTAMTAAMQVQLLRQLRQNRHPLRLLLQKEVMRNYVNAESSKVQKTASSQL